VHLSTSFDDAVASAGLTPSPLAIADLHNLSLDPHVTSEGDLGDLKKRWRLLKPLYRWEVV
jgi:hypothetical protein